MDASLSREAIIKKLRSVNDPKNHNFKMSGEKDNLLEVFLKSAK